MIAQDHLQVYTLTLTARGLVHIGNGQKTPRKEYIFDPNRNMVSFLNEQAFFDLLIRENLVDLFESFCLSNSGDLYSFLYRTCRLKPEQVDPAVMYQLSVGDALDENHSLRDINRFMRDAQGRAYVPGSSVKGALRTALLYRLISREDPSTHQLTFRGIPEDQYLHTLKLQPMRPADAVNSLMRGLLVSDSEPIPHQSLVLSRKLDGFLSGQLHPIPLCRECIAPGAILRFRLTLDQSVLKGQITAQTLLEAISAFAAYNRQQLESAFARPDGFIVPKTENMLYLGGGAGFFTKTLVYPYVGKRTGLNWTSDQLGRAFRAHRHTEKDPQAGISPRTLKYGQYREKPYAFGPCEVNLA